MVFFSPMVDIALIALIVGFISQAVQHMTGTRKAMKEHGVKMKERQKKMKELMQKNDDKSKKEVEKLQQEMLDSFSDSMKGMWKTMIVLLVISLPIFYMIGVVYGDSEIGLPIPLPWFSLGFNVFDLSTWGIEFYSSTTVIGWYILSSIITSLIIVGPLMNFVEKWRQDHAVTA